MAIHKSTGGFVSDEVHVEPLTGAKGELHSLDGSAAHVDRVIAGLADAQQGVVVDISCSMPGLGVALSVVASNEGRCI